MILIHLILASEGNPNKSIPCFDNKLIILINILGSLNLFIKIKHVNTISDFYGLFWGRLRYLKY